LTVGSKMKLKGIYGLEELECGCKIKHYRGGKTVTYKNSKCNVHVAGVNFVCIVCEKSFSKIQLKEHRWSHAI